MRSVIIAAALLALPWQTQAQEDERSREEIEDVFERGCGDDRGVDRCASETQARMYADYGIESPTELLENDVAVRRAMFVDGYGNDVAAVTFSRASGASPRVSVSVTSRYAQAPAQPLEAAISQEIWREAIVRSRDFDEQLARELPQAVDPDDPLSRLNSICMHAWFVVVEAIDPPRVRTNALAGTGSAGAARDPALPVIPQMIDGAIRSDAESTCADGLAARYAFALAELALSALPECGTLELDDFRTLANLLAQCRRLSGDRLVAGEAFRLVRDLGDARSSQDPRELRWLFVGSGDVRANMFREAVGQGRMYFHSVEGLNYDRAEVRGEIVFDDEASDSYYDNETAEFVLRLLRQSRGFKFDTFSVSDRRPMRAASQ